jgi:hypothetical protein
VELIQINLRSLTTDGKYTHKHSNHITVTVCPI